MAIKEYFTKQSIKNGITILKAAFTGFSDDLALKYSASLAYYTIFSLAPLLLLLISIAGIVLGKDAIQGKVFSEINGMVGNDAAKQIQDMIKNLELSGKSTISVIIGVVTLIIGATTVFGEIQQSINIIWQVKPKPKKGWLKIIKDRVLSGSMIVTLGFLLLVSLVLNGALTAVSTYLEHFLPAFTVTIFNIISIAFSFIVITVPAQAYILDACLPVGFYCRFISSVLCRVNGHGAFFFLSKDFADPTHVLIAALG